MFVRRVWVCLLLWVLASASPLPPPRRERPVAAASGGADGGGPNGLVLLTELSPEEVFGPELGTRGSRDKRKLNWLLDLIFWKFNTILDFKTRILSRFNTPSRKRPSSSSSAANLKGPTATTEQPPVDFEGGRVSLVLPDELFGSAFTVVTDVSKIIGSVILNSARRTQTFFEALKPIFRNAFGIRRSTSVVLGNRLPSALVIPSPPPPASASSASPPTVGETSEGDALTTEGAPESFNDT